MLTIVLVTFVDLFVFVFNALLIVRIIASYILSPGGLFFRGLVNLTEPLLLPIRKVLPPMAGFDAAPLAAFLILQGIQLGVHSLLGN